MHYLLKVTLNINFSPAQTEQMNFIYNIGILIFTFLAWLVSPFNSKARKWVRGRKGWTSTVAERVNSGERNIWIHCASLGEFEQGRPLIEAIRERAPEYNIVLTFFSPSGYEVRKSYQPDRCVCYLPADTPGNARKFVEMTNPVFALFVKYEFWNNYISELSRKGIPLYLISGIFRPGQHFFSWYGSWFRAILGKFTHFFVQDEGSVQLLKSIGIDNVTLAGDTRFDRVMQIAGAARSIPQIEDFRGDGKLLLAGSSWKEDEEIIARYINSYPERLKWVFAPHEVDPSNISRLERLFRVKTVRFSAYAGDSSDARVMIIDNIGMLSSAYRYAGMAAVGGGFGKGIHNVLEPACWGIPVLFGPNHQKFREAVGLINTGGAVSFSDYEGFESALDRWINDPELYRKAAEAAGSYVRENTGATAKILTCVMTEDINRHRS